MNFTDLVNEVYGLTNRPDKVAVTESAVKAATLYCHGADYFYKDIYETGLHFATADFIQNLDYRTFLPRYRAFKYLRKYDSTSQVAGKEIDLILPEQIFDRYGFNKTDVCYVAGAYIQIKTCNQQQDYLFGCYLYPSLPPASFISWIALDVPWAIIFRAAGTVFKTIGKDEEAAANKILSDELIAELRISNVLAEGY